MMIIIIGVWASWLMAQTLDVPSMLEFEFETEEKLKKMMKLSLVTWVAQGKKPK